MNDTEMDLQGYRDHVRSWVFEADGVIVEHLRQRIVISDADYNPIVTLEGDEQCRAFDQERDEVMARSGFGRDTCDLYLAAHLIEEARLAQLLRPELFDRGECVALLQSRTETI
jgi:hypothetical protein